ncbi:MAG: histidine phosphatase family protein [bacterium]|nr:histidine phosphatase family protein [bacterium]
MKIYLIRHGESILNGENKIQGQSDPALSPTGIRQVELLAKSLSKDKYNFIYCSELLRAKQTAELISSHLGLPISFHKDLAEIYLGEWEGKTPDEVNLEYNGDYKKWRKNPTKTLIPGAENIPEFRKRINNVFKKILKNHKEGDNVIIVAHAGTITAVIAYILKGNFNKLITRMSLTNTGITYIQGYDKKLYITGINDSSHLNAFPIDAKEDIYLEK